MGENYRLTIVNNDFKNLFVLKKTSSYQIQFLFKNSRRSIDKNLKIRCIFYVLVLNTHYWKSKIPFFNQNI